MPRTPTTRQPIRSRPSTKATSSRRDASAGRRDRASAKTLRPFTVDHFRGYARNLILDTGAHWEPEDFQLAVVEDLFAGVPEVWMILPEANGKTTLMGGVALYYGDYTESASVLLAAASRDQCGLLLGQAAGFVYRTPGLLNTRFKVLEGYRRIKCLRTDGQIQVFAADDRTGDGVIPGGIVLFDELHRARDLRLYRTWKGKLDKRGAQLAAISTAGEPDTEFEMIRAQVKAEAEDIRVEGSYTRAATAGMVLHDYSVPAAANIDDMREVKAANPFSGITVEKLAAKHKSPTMNPTHWRRFVCNQSARVEDYWIEPDAWDACTGKPALEPDQEVVVGVDIGQKKDSTAVVAAGMVDGHVHIEHRILIPEPGRPIAITEARAAVGDFADKYNVLEVAYDPYKFAESAEILEERGLLMVEFPQTDGRMAPASEALYELVSDGRLIHDGNAELRKQMLAAVPGQTERGVRISKRKSKQRVDAAVASAMAVGRLLANQGTSNGPLFEVIA